MKRLLSISLVVFVVISALAVNVSFAQDDTWGRGGNGRGQGMQTASFATGPLSEAAVEALYAGMLDEMHAYAVYDVVIAQFGEVAPFVRIRDAEAQHMAALERAFTSYGIELPEAPAVEALEFSSVAEACALGAEAEIANMEMYDDLLEAVQDYPDLTRVFTQLRDASQNNHLPAFEACAG